MASLDRNAFEPPYDDHLMFGDADEHEETRGRPLLVLLGMIVLAAFASVIWVAYNQGIKQAKDGQPPVLADESGPARVPPDATAAAAEGSKADYAKVEPDLATPPPAGESLAPAPEEPQNIVPAVPPVAAAPEPAPALPEAEQSAAPPVAEAPAAASQPEVAPPAVPLTDAVGEGGPLAATGTAPAKPRQRVQAAPTPPAVPAPVAEGAPDSTVDTFAAPAKPRSGAEALAGLPPAISPSEVPPAPAAGAQPVDPLTANPALPGSETPAAAGAPRQLPLPIEPQAALALPPSAPPAELAAERPVLPELGADVTAEVPKARPVPAAPKPSKPKAEAGTAAAAVPKTNILDEPFSGQPTGRPTLSNIESTPKAPAEPAATPESSGQQLAATDPTKPLPAPSAPASPAKEGGGFVVQLGSFMSDADAASSWAQIKSNHSGTLGGAAPEIREVDLGAKGTRYRLRVGAFSDRGEASQICRKLKSAGQDCVVAAR